MKAKEHLRYVAALCCGLLLDINSQAQTTDNASAVANPNLRLELVRMVETDQAVRAELIKKGIEHPDAAIIERMNAIDKSNLARIKAIVKQCGFPTPKLVGRDGVEADVFPS